MTSLSAPPRARRTLRAGLTALAVASSLVAVLPGGTAVAAPSPADVVVGLTPDPAEIGPAGGQVRVAIPVRNAGGATADDVTLKIELPAGAVGALRWVGESTGGWTCDAGIQKCKYGALAPGADTTLNLDVALPAGNHGDAATVKATADTRSREESTADNSAQGTIRYVALPDLAFQWSPEDYEISYLGGMGARAYVRAGATNVGTVEAPDVKLTLQPPAGAWVDTNFNGDGWDCDFSAATWVCTNGPVAVGRFVFVDIPVRFPAGTVGDTRTMSGSASTTATERSLDNNTAQASFRYVTPAPADINMIGLDVVPAHQVKAGEQFEVSVYLDNAGGSPAENVSVRVPLLPTVQPVSLDPGDPNWTCTLGDDAGNRFIECVRASYDIIQPYNNLRLRLTAGPGTPDGPLTFTATATTPSPEQSLENNTAQGSTTYVAEGVMTGRAWHDLDRDGQRDADEPFARSYTDIGKIQFLLEGTNPTWDTPTASINDFDGSYIKPLKPGRYVVHVYLQTATPLDFTTPDVGDDATDSDIVTSIHDYWNPKGLSAVVEVKDGAETVVDIGLVGNTQS